MFEDSTMDLDVCGALLLSHKTFFTASSTNLPNIIAYSYDVKVSVELP